MPVRRPLQRRLFTSALYAAVLVASCQAQTETQSTRSDARVESLPPRDPAVVSQTSNLAGVQYTDYSAVGVAKGADGDYWSKASRSMAARFSATPSVLWTVGTIAAPDHVHLSFPRPSNASDVDPHIEFSDTDANQDALKAFDQQGVRVWLMVEPGVAPVDQVIELVLSQYNSHPSLAGVGVAADWHGVAIDTQGKVIQGDSGVPVTDAAAQAWIDVLHRHDPGLRLLLMHWQSENLPPTLRKGVVFVDNGQGYASLDALVTNYAAFARKMAPAPAGFLFGTPADASWWCGLGDAPHDIGNAILAAVPDAMGLYWSDGTADTLFPDMHYRCN